jgi:predicted O-methyltransferase YrrM
VSTEHYTPNIEYEMQSAMEITWLGAKMAGAKSLLEIGSAAGQSLRYLSGWMRPGARIRSIELGEFPEAACEMQGISVTRALDQTIAMLRENGFDAQALYADSHSEEAEQWARAHMPEGGYDLVFIDGDHTLAGVVKDYQTYGPMGRMVALHDINDTSTDVPVLWNKIGGSEWIFEKPNRMGIGVIRRT